MDQRREARIQANQSVAITLFGDPDVRICARIKNVSGKGIGLVLDAPIAPGTALKMELEDTLLLGEVIYCRTDETRYYAGVELEHSLCGLGELSRMVAAFNSEMEPLESGPQRTHAMVDGGHEGHK
ncbi:MAG: type pilus assembly PilZ [Candidatus Solibacter sp.]|jgi:hypothetical protein|nr:type pilus assembly PilZ [Candidatus Solibacter sp.]